MRRKKAELPLRHWLEEKNISGILFDLDDTLIKTTEIFKSAVQKVIALYAQALPHLDSTTVAETFSRIDMKNHLIYAVNPNRWEPILSDFEAEVKLQRSKVTEALKILAKIYTQHPEYEAGVQEVLQILKKWGLLMGLVTHANVEWTAFKLASLGLDSFFDHVEIVDENQIHKASTDWQAAAQQIQVAPANLFAIGDNVKGDVQAAYEAGIGTVGWVDKKHGWQLYRQGELPSGIVVVENIGQILKLGEA